MSWWIHGEHYEPHEQLSRISDAGLMHGLGGTSLTPSGYTSRMSVATGVIRGGQLVLEGEQEPLPEGRRFTLVIEDEGRGFHLDTTSLLALREAQAEIRRGNFISEEQVLAELDEE